MNIMNKVLTLKIRTNGQYHRHTQTYFKGRQIIEEFTMNQTGKNKKLC